MKIISLILFTMFLTVQDKKPLLYDVQLLSDIPDNVGFAGSIGGVSNGVLIMAGGSNFPEGTKPWSGGIKKWYKDIYVLQTLNGSWEKAGSLPQNLGYAVSVSYKDALICAGGSNEAGHSDKVFGLRWKNKTIEIEHFPNLPFTLANASGEIVGNKLFIAGGLQNPESQEVLNTFLMLDLEKPNSQWEALSSWPGSPRMLSVSASYEDSFFLFSGTSLITDPETKNTKRKYLNDAYVYNIKTNDWKALSPLKAPVVAAAGPALVEKSRILILGGDNGQLAEQGGSLQDHHPGFGNSVVEYSIKTDTWSQGQDFPIKIRENVTLSPNKSDFLPVTAPLVKWNKGYALIGGEVRPGTRTPKVYFIKMKQS